MQTRGGGSARHRGERKGLQLGLPPAHLAPRCSPLSLRERVGPGTDMAGAVAEVVTRTLGGLADTQPLGQHTVSLTSLSGVLDTPIVGAQGEASGAKG